MTWIPLIHPNMDISKTVLERTFDNDLFDIAQKVAIYTVIPFILIAGFEAIFKNLVLVNLANSAIVILNSAYDFYEYLCIRQ